MVTQKGPEDDFLESRARSFTDLWPVAPEYRIVDGHVCPMVDGRFIQQGSFHSSKGCSLYLPMARPEIPGELAKAATGRESDILTFASHNGLLGYPQELLDTRLLGLARLSVPDEGEEEPPLRGDPLPWVLAHARTVQLVLDLLARLDDDQELRVFLQTLTVRTGNLETIDFNCARRGYAYQMHSTRAQRPGEGPRDVALDLVATLLNEGLRGGVSRCLVVEHQKDKRQGFSSLFQFHNLLDCVYWHLADAAAGNWVRRCKNPKCGAFFVARSEKVKYCPPQFVPGFENKSVSQCMNRDKARKYRRDVKSKANATRRARRGRKR